MHGLVLAMLRGFWPRNGAYIQRKKIYVQPLGNQLNYRSVISLEVVKCLRTPMGALSFIGTVFFL